MEECMSLDPNDAIDLHAAQTTEVFLSQIDHMIESTEEFIADDKLHALNDPEHRFQDIAALQRVRELYTEVFEVRT
jgi:hypothetical protein